MGSKTSATNSRARKSQPATTKKTKSSVTPRWKVDAITVGERFRTPTNVDDLVESIGTHGLLQPIVIRRDGTLVAGYRRLCAVKALGWTDVPVVVIDPPDLRAAEVTENVARVDFLPSERVHIANHFRPELEAAADARMKAGGGPSGNLPQGRVSDVLARMVGWGRKTLDKASQAVEAARQRPEFAELVGQMDATGKVDAAWTRLRAVQHRDERIAALARSEGSVDVRCCDFRELLGSVTDAALVFADPPFNDAWRENLPDLAAAVAKALGTDGSFVLALPPNHTGYALPIVTEHIPYRWTLVLHLPGSGTHMRAMRLRTHVRLLHVFGPKRGPFLPTDYLLGEQPEKTLHPWQMPLAPMEALVDWLTKPGDLVVDPTCGSGTTGVATLRARRRFIGGDSDADAVGVASRRLGAEALAPFAA